MVLQPLPPPRERRSTQPTALHRPTMGDIEPILHQLLADLTPLPVGRGRGRPAVLPAVAVWGGLLVCVLSGWSSQLTLWRLLTEVGLWDYPRFPVSDQAIYHRLS